MSKILFRYRTLCGYCSTKATVDFREVEIKKDEDGNTVIECLNCHNKTDFIGITINNPYKYLRRRPIISHEQEPIKTQNYATHLNAIRMG